MSDTFTNASAFSALLSHLPYLEEVSKDPANGQEINYLLEGVEWQTFAPREYLYHQNHSVKCVYLLVSGRVEEVRTMREEKGVHHRLMRESGEGRLLGIYDVLYHQPHSTWVRAIEACQVITVGAKQVNRLLYRFPNLRGQMAPLKRIARLRAIPLLEDADLTMISFLADCAEEKKLAANEQLYGPGSLAETVHVIDHGQMMLEWGNGRRLWLGNGGELGIEERTTTLGSEPYPIDHSATAVCTTELITVPRRQFSFITGINPEEKAKRLRAERQTTIDTLQVFTKWPEEARKQVLGAMSHYHISTNHLLTQQDEVADSLWVLLPRRKALLHATDAENRALPATRAEGLTYFNETALRYQTPAPSTLEAEAGSQWLRLHYRDFRSFLKLVDQPELEELLRVGDRDEQKLDAPAQPALSWLQRGERIVFFARRHWIALVAKLTLAIILTFLLLMGLILILYVGYDPAWLTTSTGILAIVTLLAYWWGIEDYRNDYLIVTNQRVVRQEKVIFLREIRQMAPLEQIQNVGIQISFWGRLLDYANVNIQTASTGGMIQFDRMARYKEIARILEQERGRRRQHYVATGKKQIYSLLENRLGVAVELPSRVWPKEGGTDGTGEDETAPQGKTSRVQRQIERDTGETIVWRKHWIVLFRNLSLPVIFIIAFLIASLFLWWTRVAGAYTNAATSVPMLFAAILAGIIFWVVEDWLNDKYILETDQVIDIEAKPLGFDEKRKVALLSNIVDINMAMPTPFHYIFNFGYVYLQTAATEGRFTFDAIPDPHGVVEIIRQRMDAVRRRSEETAAKLRAQELPDWFEIYNRLGPEEGGR